LVDEQRPVAQRKGGGSHTRIADASKGVVIVIVSVFAIVFVIVFVIVVGVDQRLCVPSPYMRALQMHVPQLPTRRMNLDRSI
jgi:hypothetical protein